MAYIITKTNGDSLITVPDTEKNTDYGVTLVGRNYSGYGVFLNDNFVSLMENFAKNTPPALPLAGQLWFNSTSGNNVLSLWDGTAWKLLPHITKSDNTPATTGRKIGDFWWDTANLQLKIWSGQTVITQTITGTVTSSLLTVNNSDSIQEGDVVSYSGIPVLDYNVVTQKLSGNQIRITNSYTFTNGDTITFTRGGGWYVIGPAFTKVQKATGVIAATIIDTNAQSHSVGLVYTNGIVTGTISGDVEFVPRPADAINGFTSIKPGFQTRATTAKQFVKTVSAYSTQAGGTTLIPIYGTVADLALGDYFVSGSVALSSYATISQIYGNNSVLIGTATTVNEGDEVTFQRGTVPIGLFNGTATDSQRFGGLALDSFPQLGIDNTFRADITVQGNLYASSNFLLWDNGGDLEFRNSLRGGDISFFANIASVGNKTRALYINGGHGTVEVAMDPITALGVATKGYVDTANAAVTLNLTNNVTNLIGTAPTGFRDLGLASANVGAISNTLQATIADVALKPYTLNAALTGAPTATTATFGDTSTRIATTAFVASAAGAVASSLQAYQASNDNAISYLAPKDSPTFTGTPVAPTPTELDNSTKIATTSYVRTAVAGIVYLAPKESPVFTGTPVAPTPAASVNSTQIATTAYVTTAISNQTAITNAALDLKSTILSPTFTGVPSAPTAGAGTNTTQIATTAFVTSAAAVVQAAVTSLGSAVYSTLNSYAPLNTPAFTGTPAAPTPPAADNTTKIATTAYVQGEIASSRSLWQGSHKFVSSSAPGSGDGVNGDIWFQV